mgnify:CR=1 FL=1
MIKVYRILTKLENEAFATFSSLDSFITFEKLVDEGKANPNSEIHIKIERISDSGISLNSVELIGLTCDSFVASASVKSKYDSLLAQCGFWHRVTNCQDHYIFISNVALPIIDINSSDIKYFSDSGKVMEIRSYSFIDSPLLNTMPVFRSTLAPRRELLCTDSFVDEYHSAHGTGLSFQQLNTIG